MKIAVWKTNHLIADTIAEAVYDGIEPYAEVLRFDTRSDMGRLVEADVNIAYGILRGCSDVFKESARIGKPWLHLDRGYWKPNHYDGYYRISLNGTQQTTGLDKIEPDYERWDALGLEILPAKERQGFQLFCPPTSYVASFFPKTIMNVKYPNIERQKDCERPLQEDLDKCSEVITFNSSVGWEALRQGIPVVSDPDHSIIGAFQKQIDFPLCSSYEERRRLFAVQASLQLTLPEIKSGLLWPLLNRLISISGLIPAKP